MASDDSIYTVKDNLKTSTQTLLLHNSTTENVLEIMQLRSLSLPRAHVQGVKWYLLSVVRLSIVCKKKFQISYKQILLRLIIVS